LFSLNFSIILWFYLIFIIFFEWKVAIWILLNLYVRIRLYILYNHIFIKFNRILFRITSSDHHWCHMIYYYLYISYMFIYIVIIHITRDYIIIILLSHDFTINHFGHVIYSIIVCFIDALFTYFLLYRLIFFISILSFRLFFKTFLYLLQPILAINLKLDS